MFSNVMMLNTLDLKMWKLLESLVVLIDIQTYCENRAAEAVAAAGREEGEHHGEDHDGQPHREAGDTSFPGVGELLVILAKHLLFQFVKIGNTFAIKNL